VVQLHERISELEDKYDTPINAAYLSEGEVQHLKAQIARVICQKGDIILLDEATSAQDRSSEMMVGEAIMGLSRRSTYSDCSDTQIGNSCESK